MIQESEFMKRLGRQMKKRRKAVKLSAKELEQRSGIHRNQIYRFEAGETMVLTSLVRWCNAMDIEISDLVTAAEKGTAQQQLDQVARLVAAAAISRRPHL